MKCSLNIPTKHLWNLSLEIVQQSQWKILESDDSSDFTCIYNPTSSLFSWDFWIWQRLVSENNWHASCQLLLKMCGQKTKGTETQGAQCYSLLCNTERMRHFTVPEWNAWGGGTKPDGLSLQRLHVVLISNYYLQSVNEEPYHCKTNIETQKWG